MAEGSGDSPETERIRLPQKPKLSERPRLKLPVRLASTGENRIKLPPRPAPIESSSRLKLPPRRSPEDVLKELAGISTTETAAAQEQRNTVTDSSISSSTSSTVAKRPKIVLPPKPERRSLAVRLPERANEGTRLRLPVKERTRVRSVIENEGADYWEKLSPSRREILERPLREAEEWLAQHFPDGYISPMVSKTQALREKEELEKQRDTISCTFVSAANALRILDEPKSDYTRDRMKEVLENATNRTHEGMVASDYYKEVFSSDYPFNQFELLEVSGTNEAERPVKMLQVLQAISQGDIAVSGWSYISHESGKWNPSHARTIVGFEKGDNNTLSLIAIDPYGAKLQRWSFRDWIVASRWQNTINSPDMSDEVIKGFFVDARMCNYIATDARIIHKKAV